MMYTGLILWSHKDESSQYTEDNQGEKEVGRRQASWYFWIIEHILEKATFRLSVVDENLNPYSLIGLLCSSQAAVS